MRLDEIKELLSAETVVDKPGAEIASVYTGDLLSDVMGHCGDGSILITVQNHLNTIAVCTLVGVEAVAICHGRDVPEDMSAAAAREGVAVLKTPMSQFEASVALAGLGSASK